MNKKICCGFVLCLVVFAGCALASKKTSDTELRAKVSTLEQQIKVLEQQQANIEKILVGQTKQLNEYKSKRAQATTTKSFTAPSNKDIQTALKNAGYYMGAIDGKIGQKTQDAIMKFQEEHDLKVDGVVGKSTWELLSEYL